MPPPQTMTDWEVLMVCDPMVIRYWLLGKEQQGRGPITNNLHSITELSQNSPREWIIGYDAEDRFCHHMGCAGNGRYDHFTLPPALCFERASDDALRRPLRSRRQFAIGR